jgi:hypothetical protein
MKGSRASSPNPAFNVDAGSSTPAEFAAASAFVDYLKQKVREKGGSGSTSVSATAVQTFHDQEQRLLSLQLQITKGPASDYRSQEPCLNLAAEIEELRAVRVKTTSNPNTTDLATDPCSCSTTCFCEDGRNEAAPERCGRNEKRVRDRAARRSLESHQHNRTHRSTAGSCWTSCGAGTCSQI